MKVILFVGVLLIVLVMVSGWLTIEGYRDDDKLTEDIGAFDNILKAANKKTKHGFDKNENTSLENLVFNKIADKQELDRLIEKYNNINNLELQVTGKLGTREAKRRLTIRKNINVDESE